MTRIFFTILKVLCILITVNGECNKCQKNYAACLDETRFQFCTGGKPDDFINTCPDGYVCTTSSSVCLRLSSKKTVTPSCQMTCGVCNSPGKLFSCLSNITYAFCFGEDVPDLSAKGICPEGYVCNLKSNEICKKSSEEAPSCNAVLEHIDSTTSSTSTTQTTEGTSSTTPKSKTTNSYGKTTIQTNSNTATAAEKIVTDEVTSIKTTTAINDVPLITSPTQSILSTTQMSNSESSFCKIKRIDGVFRPENDPTCQKFILCYYLAGQFLELQYTCSGSNYFNEQTKSCQPKKPMDCF